MIQVDFTVLSWIFAIAITVHNIEEAIWLPQWSLSAGRWHHPVDPKVFRFAVLILTLFACVCSILASIGEKHSIGAYLISGYAFAMLLNVVFPHLVASFALKKYTPGLITALIFNLPITVSLLYCAVQEGYIDLKKFYYVGPVIAICILGSISVLFAIGKLILTQKRQS